MATNIYYVRHGSVDNKEAITYGRMAGFDLDAKGRHEAEKAASYLADKHVDAIFTSPLARCFETAEIIAKVAPQATIKHVYELIEVEASRWQGLKWEDVVKNMYYEEFINDPSSLKVDESLSQLASRMEKMTHEILTKHAGGNIVCVSHEFPILALKLHLENIPLESLKNYSLAPGGVIQFVFDKDEKLIKTEVIAL